MEKNTWEKSHTCSYCAQDYYREFLYQDDNGDWICLDCDLAIQKLYEQGEDDND